LNASELVKHLFIKKIFCVDTSTPRSDSKYSEKPLSVSEEGRFKGKVSPKQI
jgi:hypothetical protein